MLSRPAGRRHRAVQPDALARPADPRRGRLPGDLPGRGDAERRAAHRPPASARLPDAGVDRLAHADRRRVRADARRRPRGGSRARSGRVHAPGVGRGEPDGPDQPPHLRLDPHRHGGAHRGGRSRTVPGRRIGLSGARARRAAVGPGGRRSARLVGRARLVPSIAAVGLPGVARVAERTGGARARRRASHDAVGELAASARHAVRPRRRSRSAATTSARRGHNALLAESHARVRPRQPCTAASESVQVETDMLRFGSHGGGGHHAPRRDGGGTRAGARADARRGAGR